MLRTEGVLHHGRPPDEPGAARTGDRREELGRVARPLRLDTQIVELLVRRWVVEAPNGLTHRSPRRPEHIARLERAGRGRRLLHEQVELVDQVAEPR